METPAIKALNEKLNQVNGDVIEIEMELQEAWNEVFRINPIIQKALSKLYESRDFTTNKYGEISSFLQFYDLSDFKECARYFTEFMREFHCVEVNWDYDFLLLSQGECLIIQDDTRHDNGVWLEHKRVIDESAYKDEDGVDTIKRNSLIESYMERTGFFPGVFKVDCHGNIFLVNTQPKETA